MSEYLIQGTTLEDIADAIRAKNGTSNTYTPAQMAAAILAIAGLDDVVVEFNAMNANAKAYMQNVTYTDANYETSQMANSQYLPSSGDYTKEDPVGYTVNIPANGKLYIVDENDKTIPVQSYDVSEGNFVIYNLIPNHISRWFVISNGVTVIGGRIRALGQLRMIYTDSLHNFRDLGGWTCNGGTIRYGKIIRGGEANGVYNVKASAADIVRLRNLGIKQEVDMRGASETAQTDDDPTNDITSSELGDDVYYAWLPNAVGTSMLTPGTTQYTNFVEELKLIIDRVIHGLPVYLHCQGGADRTGVTALMIEAVLGVSKSDVSKDYELTSLFTVAGGMVGRYITDERWLGFLNVLDNQNGNTLEEKAISWFVTAGITQDTLNKFRSSMIDGDPAIIDVPVTSISIDGESGTAYTGRSITLKAQVTPSYATTPITWTSSNNSVATVVNGIVTALSAGTATITASADGVSDTYALTVLDASADSNLLHHAVDNTGMLYNGGTGYKVGYRLKSDGTETILNGGCVTGFIPVSENDVVTLSGITGLNCTDSSLGTNVKIAAFDSNFTQLWNAGAYNAASKLAPTTTDGNDLTSFTLVSSTSYPCANVTYIRFSVYDTTQDGINSASSVTAEEYVEPVAPNLLVIDGRTKQAGYTLNLSESVYYYQTTVNGSLGPVNLPADAVVSNAKVCGTVNSNYYGFGFPVQVEAGKNYKILFTAGSGAVSSQECRFGWFKSDGTFISFDIVTSGATKAAPTEAAWCMVAFIPAAKDKFVSFENITFVEVST